MPIEIKDCDAGIGVIILAQGILTAQEVITHHKRHLTQDKEKFSKYRYSLSDLTAVTQTDVTNDTVKLLADMCIEASKMNPHPIVAIAASDDLVYGFSRMIDALMYETRWETNVFRSKTEAKEWIKEKVSDKFGINNLTFKSSSNNLHSKGTDHG